MSKTPMNMLNKLRQINLSGYIGSNLLDILGHLAFLLTGAAGGGGLGAPAMAGQLGIGASAQVPEYSSGTGPQGLPYTGLFWGHRGEIVLPQAESDLVRKTGGNNVINVDALVKVEGSLIADERVFEDFVRKVEDRLNRLKELRF